ncbi:MAG TPA: universal stress protein, partial [Phycisphaerae bacterium]|nr:universal stress protein [Phycisphaerae bacterium]
RRRKTPWFALLGTGGIVVLVIAALRVEDVASCASMMFLFLFFLVNLCVIKIRTNMGDELSYGFVMPLFPLFPMLAILCQAMLAISIVHLSPLAWVVGPAWVLAGVGIYFFYSRRRAVATADEIRVFQEQRAPAEKRYRIMVAVANPHNALELVQTTYKLCGAKQARVELLHMVPVPDQVPLGDAHRYMLEGKEGVLEAMLSLGLQFPINTTLRYCRNPARGIVSAVREKRVDMLILGWHGRGGGHPFRLGSTIDPVIERSPCSVVVLKDCGGNQVFRRVLVPLAGGPNGAFALEVAAILADREEGVIVPFTVRTGPRPFDVESLVAQLESGLRLPPERVQTKSIGAKSVVQGILDEAKAYDLVVMGCTHESLLRQMTHDPVPETIAKHCRTPLVMVKASGGIRSWIKRWV